MHSRTYKSHLQPHSNIGRNTFHSATTIPQPQHHQSHLDTTIPNTMPVPQRRRKITMLIDDTIIQHGTDTETSEHIVEYLDQHGTIIMTQVVNAQVWALHEGPFARRRGR